MICCLHTACTCFLCTVLRNRWSALRSEQPAWAGVCGKALYSSRFQAACQSNLQGQQPCYCCCAAPPFLQGTYQELLSSNTMQDLLTNKTGQFTVPSPKAAHYRFTAGQAGSCQDSLTKITVSFPLSLDMPPTASSYTTAIALLTVPATTDPAAYTAATDPAAAGLVPAYLWSHVYSLFGYNAADLNVSSSVMRC